MPDGSPRLMAIRAGAMASYLPRGELGELRLDDRVLLQLAHHLHAVGLHLVPVEALPDLLLGLVEGPGTAQALLHHGDEVQAGAGPHPAGDLSRLEGEGEVLQRLLDGAP